MKVFKFDVQRFVETINFTEGHDNITVTAAQQIINALGGNDTVRNLYWEDIKSNITISGGDGADSILSGTRSDYVSNNVSISGGNDNDWVSVVGSNATIAGDNGDDNIYASLNSNSISGGAGNDYLEGYGKNITLMGESGNDTVYVEKSNYAFIEGGEGADQLLAGGRYHENGGIGITISGGNGNDYIRTKNNTGGSIIGGSGADTIVVLDSPQNITVNGGWGNDSISIESSEADVVYGFDDNDTLRIAGSSYSTTSSVNDLIVNVTSSSSNYEGNITLVGAANKSLNLVTNATLESAPPTLTPTPTIEPDPTPSYIIQKSNNVYTYSSGDGNKTITSYQENEIIRLDDYQGLDDISGRSFFIKSRSGRLDIQNCHGKWLGYSAFNSEVIAYSYVASGSENVNGNLHTQSEILIGAHNTNNSIASGTGDSSLWGGNGGNDTLVGGDGYNEFFYTVGNGNDLLQNAGSYDLVNLLGVSFSQISGYSHDSNSTTVHFNDGGSLRVEGSSLIDYAIEGNRYWYSRYSEKMYKS